MSFPVSAALTNLSGLGGNDTISGGRGNDTLNGDAATPATTASSTLRRQCDSADGVDGAAGDDRPEVSGAGGDDMTTR
jgi:Ca2+-binding RTX toxin-like protein